MLKLFLKEYFEKYCTSDKRCPIFAEKGKCMISEDKFKKNGDIAPYLFNQGTNYRAYLYLGAHKVPKEDAFVFRTWAPDADSVSICGDFSDWENGIPMERKDGGIWECTVRGVRIYDAYKYRIVNGTKVSLKSDPYAFHFETPPQTASKVYDVTSYVWNDGEWMERRRREYDERGRSRPLNIYELHIGSWKTKEDGLPYSYRELAYALAPYLKTMGYTHVELLPVMEHPFDGSWGYQVTGYFAPTSRFGTPEDFMYFIDCMHQSGIGVILDWVPAHFPKDAHGLYEYDGQPLYEYQGWDKIEHEGWGTRRFDLGRNEVESFLVSGADFWLRMFHADGLRVDAVASMLYLDFDKRPGEWIPNQYGTNVCLEAVAFFKKLNAHIKGEFPDVLMIAEESAATLKITGFDNDGLGFDYKWNMGWMNDILSYCELDPLWRGGSHEKLNFSMMYAFSENFILPVSHDEVVHGKKSLLDRMPGDYRMKFSGDRAFMVYMMTHPGKKLSFMGNEIGQFTEWDYKGAVEWFLLEYDAHRQISRFSSDLNNLYLSRTELWEQDDSWDGFDWIMADNKEASVVAYMRYNKHGDGLLCVVNFSATALPGFKVGIPYEGWFSQLINSELEIYGGGEKPITRKIKSKKEQYDGRPYSLTFDLPPLCGIIFQGKRIVRRKSGEGDKNCDVTVKKEKSTGKGRKSAPSR